MAEQEKWGEHAAFMNALVKDGFIVLGGPLGDGTRILLIVDGRSTWPDGRRLWPPHPSDRGSPGGVDAQSTRPARRGRSAGEQVSPTQKGPKRP